MTDFLKELNQEQRLAVLNTEGPTLVVAGAGSGKTKVLTSRLAHIVKEKKAWPNQILIYDFHLIVDLQGNRFCKKIQLKVY